MRRIRYSVAASLDGYIAGPNGEADWIIMDPDIDFGSINDEFDTFLLGRRTFDGIPKGGDQTPGIRTLVFSNSLEQRDFPNVTMVREETAREVLTELKQQKGKDIWLFGGGQLFRSLLRLGVVDAVSVAIMPVLLGGGIALFPAPAERAKLRLTKHHVYPKSGIVALDYEVINDS